MELKEGSQLQNGKYTLEKKIGEGGFGITYRGVWKIEVPNPLGKTVVDYQVAVKEFFFEEYCSRDEKTGEVLTNSEKGQELFIRFKEKLKKEASILLELEHVNIVNVSEVFEENNTAYMVMEFIDGENLKNIITREQLSFNEAMKYIKQIGEALQYIHGHNIIHLDVKPANILIDKTGTAKLIDFGIAKQYTDMSQHTQAATVAAFSKGYSPIEQYAVNRKEKYGPHTDVYALGATLYHCLTGEIPTEAAARLSEDLVPPSRYNPDIPTKVEKAIMKAMELKHKDRFATVAEFMNALENEDVSIPEEVRTRVGVLPDDFKENDTKYIVQPGAKLTASVKEKKTVVSNVNTGTDKKKKENSKAEKRFKEKSVASQKKNTGEEKRKTSNTKMISIVIVAIAILLTGVASIFLFNNSEEESINDVGVKTSAQAEKENQEIASNSETETEVKKELEETKRVDAQEVSKGTKNMQSEIVTNKKTELADQVKKENVRTEAAQKDVVKPAATVKTIVIDGNKYTGEVRDGKPDGNGRLTYSYHERISEYDPKVTMSEVGDYMEGKWTNGSLEYGTLYDKNGVKKTRVIVGR